MTMQVQVKIESWIHGRREVAMLLRQLGGFKDYVVATMVGHNTSAGDEPSFNDQFIVQELVAKICFFSS